MLLKIDTHKFGNTIYIVYRKDHYYDSDHYVLRYTYLIVDRVDRSILHYQGIWRVDKILTEQMAYDRIRMEFPHAITYSWSHVSIDSIVYHVPAVKNLKDFFNDTALYGLK